MMNMRRYRHLLLSLLIAAVTDTVAGADLVAVVNVNRPETSLTVDQLTKIFRGEIRYWPNRQKVTVVVPPEHSRAALSAFVSSVLNLDAARYDTYWEEKRFRGEVTSVPQRFPDEDATLREIESTNNAIALLDAERFNSIKRKGAFKVLQIDGKSPGQPGYKLTFP
jgi:ABC-type phosphate transport system substrate-binding protein